MRNAANSLNIIFKHGHHFIEGFYRFSKDISLDAHKKITIQSQRFQHSAVNLRYCPFFKDPSSPAGDPRSRSPVHPSSNLSRRLQTTLWRLLPRIWGICSSTPLHALPQAPSDPARAQNRRWVSGPPQEDLLNVSSPPPNPDPFTSAYAAAAPRVPTRSSSLLPCAHPFALSGASAPLAGAKCWGRWRPRARRLSPLASTPSCPTCPPFIQGCKQTRAHPCPLGPFTPPSTTCTCLSCLSQGAKSSVDVVLEAASGARGSPPDLGATSISLQFLAGDLRPLAAAWLGDARAGRRLPRPPPRGRPAPGPQVGGGGLRWGGRAPDPDLLCLLG